jgi:hypothetical protein
VCLLRSLVGRLFRPRDEVSRLVVGSTGSGKSEGELVELVRLAERRTHAVVLLDPHGPLARRSVGHWARRGHEPRVVYEPLAATDRVLGWPLVPPITGTTPAARRLERAEARDDLAQCLTAPRGVGSLADRPLTREWVDAALGLLLLQRDPFPLTALPDAFRVGSPGYRRLLAGCDDPALVAKFRDLEQVRRRQPFQYETLTGAARRLVEQACESEVLRLRAAGPFDWAAALAARSLVAFDGGGVRSRELRRTFFLLASVAVLHAVRRHFAATGTPLPVVLVLEEAGALGLVSPFVLLALQELRKAGLAVHVLTQSTRDFGDPGVFEAVLANTPVQCWHQCLSPADQWIGARALANAAFDPHAVHYTRSRPVRAGVETVRTESRGESFAPGGHLLRTDVRTGAALVPRMDAHDEPYFKPPSLQEQEFRTRLATLRVGERVLRTRDRVTTERVRMLRSPHRFDAFVDAVIARVRSHPVYRDVPVEASSQTTALPDAAERLHTLMQSPAGERPATPE